jgi:hypothetical protein
MALLDRHGTDGVSQVRTEVLSSLKRGHLRDQIAKHVEDGASLHTDSFPSYEGLHGAYTHHVIDHAEAYVDGNVHTNNCENFWSLLKRAIRGTYVSVEPFHLFRYLDEQAFASTTERRPTASGSSRLAQPCSANASPIPA